MAQQRTKKSAHAQLAQLEKELAVAKMAAREAEAVIESSHAEIESIKDRIRQAYADGEPTSELTAELGLAREKAEEAVLRREGLSRAAHRAEHERHGYLAGNAHSLLKELEPEANAVVADIATRAQALVEADRRWTDLQVRVNSYLVAMGVTSAGNAPATHALSSIVRDLRHSSFEVVSPLPHFVHRDGQQEDELRKREQRNRRKVA